MIKVEGPFRITPMQYNTAEGQRRRRELYGKAWLALVAVAIALTAFFVWGVLFALSIVFKA